MNTPYRTRLYHLVVILICFLSAATAQADDQSELLDRLQIMELQSRYALAHDLFDPAAYAAVFTEDAELIGGGGKVVAKGREALRTMTINDRKRLNGGAPENERRFGAMRHVITNSVIDIQSADSASGLCYFTVVADRKDHGPEILSMGRYEDRYRKVNGKWLIARREIYSDMNNSELTKQVLGN
jgi:hypothetical protein